MSKFWQHFLIVQLGFLAIAFGQFYFDLLGHLIELDSTYISIGITLIASASSVYLLFRRPNDMQWFIADAVLSLGMVGTLVGFLIVLGQSFTDIDTSSVDSMTNAISVLASGMSTALVTSLVGLVASLWLKLQLVVIEDEEV